jgi:hypothetical protein
MSALQNIVLELRRREVFRAAGLYIVGSWVVLQVAALAFQSLGIPDTALSWVWIAVFVGFPLALFFAWRYDMTMKGIVRTPPAQGPDSGDLALRPVDYLILASLGAVVAITGAKTFIEIGDIDATRTESANERVILVSADSKSYQEPRPSSTGIVRKRCRTLGQNSASVRSSRGLCFV